MTRPDMNDTQLTGDQSLLNAYRFRQTLWRGRLSPERDGNSGDDH